MNEIAVFSICFNYALTAFNVCFSLYMKKKGASLWWTNIPAAALSFCLATSRIFML